MKMVLKTLCSKILLEMVYFQVYDDNLPFKFADAVVEGNERKRKIENRGITYKPPSLFGHLIYLRPSLSGNLVIGV